MKKLLILTLALFVSACSFQQAADVAEISVETALVSDSVDEAQTEYGEYVVAQDALIELDLLQAEIKEVLSGNVLEISTLETYYYRAVAIYNTLYAEAVERQGELTDAQIAELTALNVQLLDLNEDITNFTADESNSTLMEVGNTVLSTLIAASKIYSVYSAF